ncbi:DUF5641 domain-containing protein [Nephila pilipes]|uniref:DUF5641 domain-containing protein n=1 Tax=Nephila pilipes TaxID=299642 RepID=A0A8X6PM09_NEPPI|nr:DUF5641 domain-containing protein [Nephila pilipes]
MAQAKFDHSGWEFTGEAISLKDLKPTPVLGLLWDKSKDVLFCDNSFVETPPDTITRRVILSYANRVFDSIGFTCPVSLQPKILLQKSWRSKVSWDSEVSTDMKKKFLKWIEDIKMLHLVKIPRKFLIGDVSSVSFHVFCDASGISYAAAVFIRCKSAHDIPTVGMPDLDKLDTTDVKGRLKYQQSLRQHLRSRLRRENLGILLQPRMKSTYYEVKPGEIVLIEDDSKKRLLWPMAKVLEVYPGKDNTVRVVRVKTQSGEIVRPIRQIYPLEINYTNDESHSSGKLLTTRSGRTVKVP